MISILLVSMREEKTIQRCIQTLTQGLTEDFELLVSIPDEGTWVAAVEICTTLGFRDRLYRSNLSKQGLAVGKPKELSQLMDMAQGDFWIFCDGDTFFGDSPILKLLQQFKKDEIQAVSGRPISADTRSNRMGYFGHLLSEAAHFKRMQESNTESGFFPVSGYLFAMRASNIRPKADSLAEDAYISYKIHNSGGKIGYAPKAEVFVYYPKTLSDYFKQKKRSAGGYYQLKKYNLINTKNTKRSFLKEMEFWWFPLRYAQNKRELWWSLQLYPIRVLTWFLIFWEQKILKKDFGNTWSRVESTKG
jgi:cellulose synthase/poly-beta-1,6-N-acetylglucosamine synthase-like glycosyltransferase